MPEMPLVKQHLASHACMFSCLTVVQFLVNHGANVNNSNNAGETPLHWACSESAIEAGMESNIPTVQYLLEHGANVRARNEDGETPLDWARSSNQTALVIYFETNQRYKLIHYCAQNGFLGKVGRKRSESR